jgi:hypothetical protein
MKLLKKDVINCGIFFIHGLNGSFEIRYTNGEEHELNFFNVLICDSEDPNKATWSVWDRVWKSTEKIDKNRILLFGYSNKLLEALEYAAIMIRNTDNYHSEVFDFEELIKQIRA